LSIIHCAFPALDSAWGEHCSKQTGPITQADVDGDLDDGLGDAVGLGNSEQPLRAHVVLPSEEGIEQQLLKKRKQELLDRYTGADYLAEQSAMKELRALKDAGR
jgi:hypothetical protein